MSHHYSSGGAVLEKENLYASLELALQESGSAQAEKQDAGTGVPPSRLCRHQ